jgi:hypothetical protein
VTQVVTYYSSNAKPNQAWIAYALLPDGNIWQVRCEGASEQEASQKAINLYEAEKGKWARLEPYKHEDSDEAEYKPSGRGVGLAGKIWVFNRATGQRARIDAAEMASYEAKGYIKGGPRSK